MVELIQNCGDTKKLKLKKENKWESTTYLICMDAHSFF